MLPPYQRLVLDEAHHLEDVAASHLGVQVTSRAVRRLLGAVRAERPRARADAGARADGPERSAEPREPRSPARAAASRRWPTRAGRATRCSSGSTSGSPRRPAGQLRLGDDFAVDPIWDEGLGVRARRVAHRVPRAARERWRRSPTGWPRPTTPSGAGQILQELRGVLRRLDAVSDGLNRTLRPAGGGPPTVRWMERTHAGPERPALGGAARSGAGPARAALRPARHRGAHQRHAGRGRRVRLSGEPAGARRRRLAGDRARDLRLAVRLPVAVPLRHPHRPARAARGRGRATAPRWSRSCPTWPTPRTAGCSCCSPATPRCGGRPRSSGWRWAPAGRSWCRARRRATCCCAASARRRTRFCWARTRSGRGWTCPGRALRALVLNKLPFKVPSEPLTAARLERLAEEGQDGFLHYLLPHAALKLKQGFGRLIRSRQDVGVVVLLDSRVVTKRYGPLLLGGLPRAERVVGHLGAGAHQVRGLLRPARHRSHRMTPVRPVEDHRHRPQLRRPREGAGQRDAGGPDHLLQAAHRADRRR